MSARRLVGGCAAAAGSFVLVTGMAGAAAGGLDPSFGTDGRAIVPVGQYGATSLGSTLQADNKVVLVGTNLQLPPPAPPTPGRPSFVEDEDFYAVRLTADGALDPSFGSGGIVRTPIDLDPGAREVARDAAVDPNDGSIVVVGEAYKAGYLSDVAFVRYTPSGELDRSFSDDGIQTLEIATREIAYAVAVQPDDSKIVAAFTDSGHGNGFGVVRLNADGSVDRTFGVDGVTFTFVAHPAKPAEPQAIALDGSRIVVAGGADVANQAGNFALVRHLADGSLDPAFNHGRPVVTPGPENEIARAVTVTKGHKILVAGYGGSGSRLRFRLARYTAKGRLDSSFGRDGIVTTAIGRYSGAVALALQPNGKAIAGGWSNAGPSFALARYNTDGSLDKHFGDGGTKTFRVGTLGGEGTSIAIQRFKGGRFRLVQTGTAWEQSGGHFAAIGLRIDDAAVAELRCHVPHVIALRLPRARALIRARGCAVGRVRRARSRRAPGLVIGQQPKAGLRAPAGTRVALVVSRGLVLLRHPR